MNRDLPKIMENFVCIENANLTGNLFEDTINIIEDPTKIEIDTENLYEKNSNEYNFYSKINKTNHTFFSVNPEKDNPYIKNIFDTVRPYQNQIIEDKDGNHYRDYNIIIQFKVIKNPIENKLIIYYDISHYDTEKQKNEFIQKQIIQNIINFVMQTIQNDHSLYTYFHYITKDNPLYFQFDYRINPSTNVENLHRDRSDYVILCFDKDPNNIESFTTQFALSEQFTLVMVDKIKCPVKPIFVPIIENIMNIKNKYKIKYVLHKFKISLSQYNTIVFSDPVISHQAPIVEHRRHFFRIKFNFCSNSNITENLFTSKMKKTNIIPIPFIEYNELQSKDIYKMIKTINVEPNNQIDENKNKPILGSFIDYNEELKNNKCVLFRNIRLTAYGGKKPYKKSNRRKQKKRINKNTKRKQKKCF